MLDMKDVVWHVQHESQWKITAVLSNPAFSKDNSVHVLEFMCWKLVFYVLLCTCVNECNVSMTYVCFKCNYPSCLPMSSPASEKCGNPLFRFKNPTYWTRTGTYRPEYYMTIHQHKKVTQCRMPGNLRHISMMFVMKAPMFQHNGHNNPNYCNNSNNRNNPQ